MAGGERNFPDCLRLAGGEGELENCYCKKEKEGVRRSVGVLARLPALRARNCRQDCRAAPPTHVRKPTGRLTHADGFVTLNEKVPLSGIIQFDKNSPFSCQIM